MSRPLRSGIRAGLLIFAITTAAHDDWLSRVLVAACVVVFVLLDPPE